MIPLLLTTSLLAACAVGPDYKAPKTAAVAAAPFVGAANPAFTRDAVQDRWWTLYNDPVLTRMVEDALAANTDIRVAAARVERARAMLRNAKAARLPTTSIDASATRDRFLLGPVRHVLGGAGGMVLRWRPSLSYEVDLFGRVRRGVEAANGDADAAEADADGVRLAVVADTVRAYLDVTTSAQRLKVAQDTVALLDQSIRITGARVDVGRSDRLDLIRVTTLRDQQAATIPRSPPIVRRRCCGWPR
jgi:outer membrane protein TolC